MQPAAAFLVAIKQDSRSNGDSSAPEAIVGYICGTLSKADKLTHDSMQTHEAEGEMLCIHSARSPPHIVPSDCQGLSSK